MKASSSHQNTRARRASRLKTHRTGSEIEASNGISGGGGGSPRRQKESIQEEVTPDHVDLENDMDDLDPDSIQNLRFSEKRWSLQQRGEPKLPEIVWDTQTVCVMRRRPELYSKTPKPDEPKLNLMLPAGRKEEDMTMYEGPCGLPRRGVEALHSHGSRDRFLPPLKHNPGQGQEAALANWDKAIQAWESSRLQVSQVLGVQGSSLLMAQPMPLPPVQHHCGPSFGPDSDFPQYTQKERFYKEDAFFRTPERVGDPEEEVMFTFPWSERKLYEPPVTTVQPLLGEQPPFADPSESSQFQSHEAIHGAEEELNHLWVKGRQMLKEDEDIESNRTEEVELSLAEYDLSTQRVMGLSTVSPRYNALSGGPVSDSTSPYYTRHSVPAMQLGRFIYIWGQPSVRGLVEVGVVTNVGERGKTYINLTNVGCCVMRYIWRYLPTHDNFNTGRTRRSPFIFDLGDGCLLPEQKISIFVQFHSPLPGCWRERWLLETVPRLYSRRDPGDSEICISLWGRALEVDVNLNKRLEMDQELLHESIVKMAQRWVDDLVNTLPLRSYEEQARAAMKRWQDLHIEVFLAAYEADVLAHFSRLNPSLHYHSAALAQVGTACFDLQLLQKSASSLQPPSVLTTLGTAGIVPLGARSSRKNSLFNPTKRRRSSQSGKNSQIVVSENTSPPVDYPSTAPAPLDRDLQDKALQESDLHDLHKLKKQVVLGSVIREVHTSLSEDVPQKEELLCSVNSAIATMSAPPLTPSMAHTNHMFVRAGLVQLMDSLADMEVRLRISLDLQNNPRFQRLSTFPRNFRRSSSLGQKTHSTSVSTSKKSSGDTSSGELSSSSSSYVMWEDPLAAQYRRKLYVLIYDLLASGLPGLFPLVTQKELRPNFPC